MSWFWFCVALAFLFWNAYLMWCNAELRADLRRAKARQVQRSVSLLFKGGARS